jgi:phosphotransferase system  glucose/maltose/N-acetylglucosamine-specific IIC component
MRDEEFVKMKHWIDAEFTMLHIFLAIIIAYVAHKKYITIAVIVYVVFSILYAASRLTYVEKLEEGYLRLPKR